MTFHADAAGSNRMYAGPTHIVLKRTSLYTKAIMLDTISLHVHTCKPEEATVTAVQCEI